VLVTLPPTFMPFLTDFAGFCDQKLNYSSTLKSINNKGRKGGKTAL